jgi:integrase
LCTFHYTSELIAANPMPLVGRPKIAKTLPKALPTDSVAALLVVLSEEPERPRRADWLERDRALILTALLAGLRADELLRANVGDLRRTEDGAVIHVRGKGGKDRRIPIEAPLVEVLEHYLDSRATRFPTTARKRSSPAGGLAAWGPAAPLFVGADGERISRGTLQYRVLRAFRRAGIDADRARGALVHGLRHTFATELANSDISVYTLMKLLGHESMVTSQRYVTAAGTETRTAAAQNKLYSLLADDRSADISAGIPPPPRHRPGHRNALRLGLGTGVVDTTTPAPIYVREAIAIRYLGEQGGRAFVQGYQPSDTVLFTVRPGPLAQRRLCR